MTLQRTISMCAALLIGLWAEGVPCGDLGRDGLASAGVRNLCEARAATRPAP